MMLASKINNPNNSEENPRIGGLNAPGTRPQSSNYDQMKINAQKMNYVSDFMANKPPTGARAMSAGGNGVNPYSPSPRVQQYSLVTNSTPFASAGYNGSSPNTAGLYHIMSNAQATSNAAGSATTPLSLMSSSMPLTPSQLNRPSSANGPVNKVGSTDSAEVCSILSTSSLSKKGQARSSGTPTTKKRVRFAEKLTTCYADGPIRNTPPPYLGASNTPPMSAAAKKTIVPLAGISFVDSPAATPADVQYSANMTNGTLVFHDSTPLLPTSNPVVMVPAVPVEKKETNVPSIPSVTAGSAAANTKLPVITGAAVKKTAATSSSSPVTAASPTMMMDLDSSGGSNDSSQPQTKTTSTRSESPITASLGPVHIPPATSGAHYLSQPSASPVTTTAVAASSSSSATTNAAVVAAATAAMLHNGMTPAGAAATAAVVASAAGKKKQPPAVRPSLSEQLASIGAKAEAITTDIRLKAKIEAPSNSAAGGGGGGDAALFSMPARCFTIGSLSCRFPSPIHFFSDRCEYIFNHPFEASVINMIIYYRDMSAISILGTKLKFKLPKKLACFLSDFDPQNPHHVISIEMSSMLSISMIKEKILPLISSFRS